MTGAWDGGLKRQRRNDINGQRRMSVPFVLPGLGGSQGLLRLPLPHQPPRARDVARSIPGTPGLGEERARKHAEVASAGVLNAIDPFAEKHGAKGLIAKAGVPTFGVMAIDHVEKPGGAHPSIANSGVRP